MNKEFFYDDSITLAQKLLNKYLIREYDNKKIVTKIVETEAYMGENDKAAHAYKNRKSVRTGPLYLEGGHIYVYLIYGMYNCLNISANRENIPHCVLIRAVEPVQNLEEISQNRFGKSYDELTSYQRKNLTNGPGKLCKALNIDRSLSGKYILDKELYIVDNEDDNFEIVKDKRVNIDFTINNRIHLFSATEPKNKKVIIYVHGLGGNKNWITRFYKDLLNNGYDTYSIDLISHGEDGNDFKKFNLSNCISYLKDTINYIKEKNKDSEIYLFGSSYGGFVILNAYKEIIDDVDKIYLMCPAINFCEIMEIKTGNLNIEYFDDNEYLPLYNNIKIYKDAYLEFKSGDEYIKNEKFNNIFIIQGDLDKTVDVNNVIKFCDKNKIEYKIIHEGKHELYGFDNEIVDFILNK